MTATESLYKAENGSYIHGVLTIHYTRNTPGTPYPRVRTICGQSHRRSWFGVLDPANDVPVNCRKCLEIAERAGQSRLRER